MTDVPPKPKRAKKVKEQVPTGIESLDALATAESVSIEDYARAASAYVRAAGTLGASPKKAAQIRLSNVLGRALKQELEARLTKTKVVAGERKVAGALRTVNADVSEIHDIDGLRLAIEIKPVNLAVGRAIWNRFGDIRTFAVNIHLKFPFCVVGGVLAFPTFEEVGTKAAKEAVEDEIEAAEAVDGAVEEADGDEGADDTSSDVRRKETVPLIQRAVKRLIRAGGRMTEGDAPHLLEAIAVVVYDPDTGEISAEVPDRSSGLRWDQFIDKLVDAYLGRFEDD